MPMELSSNHLTTKIFKWVSESEYHGLLFTGLIEPDDDELNFDKANKTSECTLLNRDGNPPDVVVVKDINQQIPLKKFYSNRTAKKPSRFLCDM